MKKTIIVSFIILLAFSLESFAQRNKVRDADYFPRNEIYIQYGAPTVMELATTLNKNASGTNVYGNKYKGESKNHKFSGVGGIGYNFSLTKKFAIGVYGGVSYAGGDMYLTQTDEKEIKEPIFMYTSDITSYTAQVSFSWTYFYRGSMEISSAAYLGASVWDEKVTAPEKRTWDVPTDGKTFNFAYHITAIKFRYGETFGVFAELGFGYRGLANVGLSIKL